MARQIVDLKGLSERLPLSTHQIYKGIKHATNPIPHKKFGKRLLFDLEKVWRWFDGLPGRDVDIEI